MKVIIEFDTEKAAFHSPSDLPDSEEDYFYAEMGVVLGQAKEKVMRQRARTPALCTHDESDDVLLDTNGNRIGTVQFVEATAEDMAQELIDEGNNLCHDVALFHGQDFENVKHMKWFKYAVMASMGQS